MSYKVLTDPRDGRFDPNMGRFVTTSIPAAIRWPGSSTGGAVELVAYAHSIDFGAKGYGNLGVLAREDPGPGRPQERA